MARFIVKLDGKYFEWSTVVDAPVTAPMDYSDFAAYYRNEYGEAGMAEFAERVQRVEAKGTSAHGYDSAEDLVRVNRAGPSETEWTLDELMAWVRGQA